ncbi:hypothetical protein ACOME3_002794 [Neoechinorhynchus agilis]
MLCIHNHLPYQLTITGGKITTNIYPTKQKAITGFTIDPDSLDLKLASPSFIAIRDIHFATADLPITLKVPIEDRSGKPSKLIVEAERVQNQINIHIYFPYIVLNRTSFSLQLKQSDDFTTAAFQPSRQFGFAFCGRAGPTEDYCELRASDNDDYGPKFSLDIGANVTQRLAFDNRRAGIRIRVNRSSSQFTKSILICLEDEYFFENRTNKTVSICQNNLFSQYLIHIEPEQVSAFQYVESSSEIRFRLKFEGFEWSGLFSVDQSDFLVLRKSSDYIILRLTKIEGDVDSIGQKLCICDMEKMVAPIVIRNLGMVDMEVSQVGTLMDTNVKPGGVLDYALFEPLGPQVLDIKLKSLNASATVQLNRYGQVTLSYSIPYCIESSDGYILVHKDGNLAWLEKKTGFDPRNSWIKTSDGHLLSFEFRKSALAINATSNQLVIKSICDDDQQKWNVDEQGLLLSLSGLLTTEKRIYLHKAMEGSGNVVISVKISSMQTKVTLMDIQNNNVPDNKENEKLVVKCKSLGLSVVNRHRFELEEIIYFIVSDIQVYIKNSAPTASELIVVIGRILAFDQIKSMIPKECPLMVMPKEHNNNGGDIRIGQKISLIDYRLAKSINLHAYSDIIMKLNELFIWRLAQFALQSIQFETTQKPRIQEYSLIYIGYLKMSQVTIKVSLDSSKVAHPPDIVQLRRSFLGNNPVLTFERTTLTFDSITYSHVLLTSRGLHKLIFSKYINQLKSQALSILGSLDFLGNPLGLINDTFAGVHGFWRTGDSTQFLRAVTHGIANSASKVVRNVSDGIVMIATDTEYQQHRAVIQSDYSGISQGSMSLMAGITGGLTGMVEKSYTGARTAGVFGFLGGIGKGALSSISRPMVGVLDMAHSVVSAVKESTASDVANIGMDSRRPPRHCEARFMSKVKLPKLKLPLEIFVAFVDDDELIWTGYLKRYLVLTNMRLIVLDSRQDVHLPVAEFQVDSLKRINLVAESSEHVLDLQFELEDCSISRSFRFRSKEIAIDFHSKFIQTFLMYACDFCCDVDKCEIVENYE